MDWDDTLEGFLDGDFDDYEEESDSFFIDGDEGDELGFSFGGSARLSTRGLSSKARAAISRAKRAGAYRGRTSTRSKARKRVSTRSRSRSKSRRKSRVRSRSRMNRMLARAKSAGLRARVKKRRPRRLVKPQLAAAPVVVARRAAGPCIATPGCPEPHLLRQIDARLAAMGGALRLAQTQRTATSEHNAINNKARYRRLVLKRLKKIKEGIACEQNPRKKAAASSRLRAIFGRIA